MRTTDGPLDHARGRLSELIEGCRKAMTQSGEAVIVYRMPGIYKTNNRSLFGRAGGPTGGVVGTDIREGKRYSMVMFRAKDALAAYERKLAELPRMEVVEE